MTTNNSAIDSFLKKYQEEIDSVRADIESELDSALDGLIEAFKSNKGVLTASPTGDWLDSRYVDVRSSLGVNSWYEALELRAVGNGLSASVSDNDYEIDSFVVSFFGVDGSTVDWSSPLVVLTLDSNIEVSKGWLEELSISGLTIDYNGHRIQANADYDISTNTFSVAYDGSLASDIDLAYKAYKLKSATQNKQPTVLSDTLKLYRFGAGDLDFWDYTGQVVIEGTNLRSATLADEKNIVLQLFDASGTQAAEISYSYLDLNIGFAAPVKIIDHAEIIIDNFNYQWKLFDEIGYDNKTELESALKADISELIRDSWQGIFQSTPNNLSATASGESLVASYPVGGVLGEIAGGVRLIVNGAGLSKNKFDVNYRVDSIEVVFSSVDTPNDWTNYLAKFSLDTGFAISSGIVSGLFFDGATVDVNAGAPTVSSITPADEATAVTVGANVVVVFSESVQ
ncbi:MAG: hypothetical protein EBQ48_02990, partial [Betaproteobacteria bacterium]|nr:hypothetical protein [Betaproteobacteria bacterium]